MPALPSASVVLALMCAALVCTAVDERRGRLRSIAVGVVMAAAMADTMFFGLLLPFVWMSGLVILGLCMGVRRPSRERPIETAMRVHRAIACIGMAALIALPTHAMSGMGSSSPSAPSGGHLHGAPLPLAAAFAVSLTIAGVLITIRAVHTAARVQMDSPDSVGDGRASRRHVVSAVEPSLMGISMAVMFA